MKKIILRKLSMTNFKGIRKMSVEFSEASTTVAGGNGTGKTTLYDAFTWVMFGYDSLDRKQFDIKTLDSNGNVAYQPFAAEVTAVLSVNDEEVTITRRYKENWVKTKGESEEHLAGHIEERLYNEVPCSVADFKQKIEDICPAKVFKLITSPYSFCQQKMQEQREMLITMAGGVTDAEIANGNEDFQLLLGQLSGKTLDEFKREIAAKKKRIKAEIDELPIRITQCHDLKPTACDYDAIEAEIKEKTKALESIDAQLTSAAEAFKASSSARIGLQREITALQQDIFTLEKNISAEVQSEYMKAIASKKDLEVQVACVRADITRLEGSIGTKESQITRNNNEIAYCNRLREQLIAEWKQISGERLTFDTNDFICPTCQRKYDVQEISMRQAEITARFNADHASRLAENKRKGMQCNNQRIALEENNSQLRHEIESIHAKLADKLKEVWRLKETIEKATASLPEKPDASEAIAASEERRAMLTKVEELSKKLEAGTSEADADTAELKEMKSVLNESLQTLREQLAGRKLTENIENQIAELESKLRAQSEELAKLEKTEFTVQEFSFARMNLIEDRINSLFDLVTFKMFDTQINGAIVEDCEATVNGIPFSSLNHAMQINAGLDIINTLIKHQAVSAPIFIDNAESVINLGHTDSQIIKLVVANEPLNVTNGTLSAYEKFQQ